MSHPAAPRSMPDLACEPAPTADAPFVFVVNAGSGRQRELDALVARLDDAFGRAGRRYELVSVTEPSRLEASVARAADLARGGVLVGVGGDGTLRTVARAALDAGCVFGVLPRGTFNYFSRDHGIPADPEQAIALLLTARVHPVQVGFVNDALFLVNASLGLYPKLLEQREAYKRQFGRSRLVALGSAIATLLRPHRLLRLRVDHEGTARELRTTTLFVANNRLQLEQVGAAEAPLLAQGMLVALAPLAHGRLAQILLSLRGAFSRVRDADDVVGFGFTRFTVARASRRHRRIKVATDGEIAWLDLPLEFRVADRPLRLLKPEPDVAERNRA
ncbi:diacylglycerol kinase [Burkholderia plantarii]|uniref:Diacylglycerol kinase, catalytic region n=2 Tax=Burkholderia plantarii TaxID=41899 RepID=A0A0B6RT79_BURPL|nr:diacylglycerol kinase family protein [Burkholderia plantarii]AJK46603.1 diacylglycerol kinase, catalytic region [Burkholderia plantarii]WLE59443.1 diacylglycerol kinase [Burkholderia plantarii]